MFCANCGTQNSETAGFCAKCGTPLNQNATPVEMPAPVAQPANHQQVIPETPMPTSQPVSSVAQPVQSAIQPSQQPAIQPDMAMPTPKPVRQTKSFNFLTFVLDVLMKPATTLKNKLIDFEDIKLSGIYTAIIAAITMVINAIISIYNIVYVNTAGSFSEPSYEFVWDNLKNVKWLELIFKNFLVYAGAIAIIALIYFLAGLIIKKNVKYPRLLAVVTSAFVPMVLATMILSPILGWIYSDLGVIASIAGSTYGLIIMVGGLNCELALEDNDLKIYVNTVCLSIISIAGYYILMHIIKSIITSGLGDIMSGMLS